MSKIPVTAIAAGLLSAGLLVLVALSGLGSLFLFLPTLPLFWLGLRGNTKDALSAAVIATLGLTVIANISSAFVYLLLLGLPVWYLSRYAIISGGTSLWFPLGLALTRLTVYACAAIALMAAYQATQDAPLETLMADYIRSGFQGIEPEYQEMVTALAHQWAFLVFSMSIWLWSLALYAHGWAVNRTLARTQRNLRPDFGLTVFPMPGWMLFLLALSAFASLAGSPEMAFVGKALLVALLLPYFLLGCALMHQASQTWPSRRFFLFFIYFTIFAQFWPALLLSGIGVIYHIKRLSTPENSTRS